MKPDVTAPALGSLLDAPSPAVLTLYREAGEAITYADVAGRPAGFVVRLPLCAAHAWDLADKLP